MTGRGKPLEFVALTPKSARIWRNVTHQNGHSNPQYGDDDLIDVLSHVVVRGHSDAEHMSDFADELHARGHQSRAWIAKVVANAARELESRRAPV